MKNTLLPASPCPSCCAPLSGASDLFGDAQPSPGDLSLCLYCGAFLVFGEQLEQRALSPQEFAELAREYRMDLESRRESIARMWREKGFADGKGRTTASEKRRPT